jgi:Flp pilus assembly protein TadD
MRQNILNWNCFLECFQAVIALAHIQWMLNPSGPLDIVETVLETNNTARLSLGTFAPVQFRDVTTYRSAHDRAMAAKQNSSIASPGDIADELDRLAGYIDTLKEFVQALGKISNKEDLLPPGFSLLPATLRDEADTIRSGDRTFLASHKVDAIASECLSRLEDVINKLIASGTLPKSYTFLSRIDGDTIADLASAIGQGHLDITSLTKLLDDMSKYTASVTVRLLLSPLGPQISNWAADATESFVDMALPVVRDMSASLFQNLYRSPGRATILDQWVTAQNRRMANGQPVQDLRQMYGDQILVEAGFSRVFLDQNTTDTTWFNSVIGSSANDVKDGKWSLTLQTGTAHPATLGSGSWETLTASTGTPPPAVSLPAKQPDTRDCRGDNCVASIPRKKPDSPPLCPPGAPGCVCPPGTPGCGGGVSVAVPPTPCPPDDPDCTSHSPVPVGGVSCPPKCDAPPPAAQSALLKGDWRQLASLLGADDRNFQNPVTRLLLAHALASVNRNSDAFGLFASSRSAADLEAYYTFASRLANQHRANWTAQFVYGDAMARRGDFSSAQQAFTAAMSLEPTAALPVYARGVVRSLSGDDDGAVLDLTKATQLSPTLADGWLTLSILWLRLQAGDGAHAALSETTKLSQDSALTHLVRGILLFDDGDSQGALAEMRRAGQLSPTLNSTIAHDVGIVTQSPTVSPVPVFPRPAAPPPTPPAAPPSPPRLPGGVSTKETGNARVDRGDSPWIIPYPLGYSERTNHR